MQIAKISSFDGFCIALRQAGFTMGGENSEGVFSLSEYFAENIKWHTEDPNTDPWEFRIRVLNDCDDIAYGKLFLNKGGYITKEWYPYFLAARRQGRSFEEAYQSGMASSTAKGIYGLIRQSGILPLNEIKTMGGFSKADKSKFDRALVELQMGMYITMCGKARKISKNGSEYGWSATTFCTTEDFFWV